MTLATLRSRRGTAAQWAAANPILNLGELGWETDSRRGKFGDGTTTYNSLGYHVGDLGNNPAVLVTGSGIDPTGATDSSAAIQALINAMPASGGRLHFPLPPSGGFYLINTGLTTTNPNLQITADGAPGQDGNVGNGATRIHYTGAGYAFTFQPTPTTTIYRGPKITNLHISGTSAGAGAIRINRTNNFVIRDVSVSDFTNGVGFFSDGTGNVNQYGLLENLRVSRTKNGIDLLLSNGIVIMGGALQGVHGSILAGSFGIRHQSGDTMRLYGTDVQAFETLVTILSGANASELHGLRGEDWTSRGVKIAANRTAMYGGSLNNTLNGSTGVAIEVVAGATNTYLRPAAIATGTSTPPFIDAGTNTDLRYPEQVKMQRKARGGTNLVIPTTQTTFAPFDSGSTNLFDLVFTGVLPGDWLEIGCAFRVSNEAIELDVDAQTMVTLGTGVNSVGQQNGANPLPSSGVQAWTCQPSVNLSVGGSVLYQVVAADIASDGSCTVRPLCKVTGATARTILSGAANPILWWGRNHGRT